MGDVLSFGEQSREGGVHSQRVVVEGRIHGCIDTGKGAPTLANGLQLLPRQPLDRATIQKWKN